MNEDPLPNAQTVYQVVVDGKLDERWSGWFGGLAVTVTVASDSSPITRLTASVSDQAALRGILSKLWDLNLSVRSVSRIEPGAAGGEARSACPEGSRSDGL